MIVKVIIDEDFSNYKKPSMFIGFPHCTFKCEKEYGMQVCQNGALATSPSYNCKINDVITRYLSNNLTSALVIGGLEPFDDYDQLISLISNFRKSTNDDIVIFTGYNRNEIENKVIELSIFRNIIIKFGRFIPNQEKHYDDVLGVFLASDNQYAERIN